MYAHDIKDMVCLCAVNYQVKLLGPCRQNIVCTNVQKVLSLAVTDLYEFHLKGG
jgi:hypothetical protein